MESKVPECPEDCAYRKSIGGHWPCCAYWEMEPGIRCCDPGPGCKRYLPKREHREHRKGKNPIWDVEAGKKLWEEGCTDSQIAEKLGVRRATVSEYRQRNWGEINRERRKRKENSDEENSSI